MPAVRHRPEVLAPAGSADCLPAAVAGGADAVYLGLRHFNARGRAENFRKADLARHVAYLHHHGLKCYVVLNTLVHDDEFPKALDLASAAHSAGVDAAIVQDLGLWSALGRALPGLERHASTQMTVHDPSQVVALAGLGARRVILARELSLDEVRACTDAAHAHGIETEHFVHGALCYAFSGQCLMSNFAGCRSANRGTCAQNCRFDYSVGEGGIRPPPQQRASGAAPTKAEREGAPAPAITDHGTEPQTVLSMKDFALVGRIGELADAGVASLKIEGRLKGPDYVYTVSRVYRAAADAWAAGTRFDVAAAREVLKDVFARAQTDAPLTGDYAATSRLHRYQPENDRAPDARLLSVDRGAGTAFIAGNGIRAGQGFTFAVGFWNGGLLITAADPSGTVGALPRWRCKVRIAEHGPRLPADLPLFRNADHARRHEATTAMAAVPLAAVADPGIVLDLTVSGTPGVVLHVDGVTADGRGAGADSAMPLAAARGAPLTAAQLVDKLGGLGGSGFDLGRLECRLIGDCFLPAAELKEVRRRLVAALAAQPVAEPLDPLAPALPPEPGVPRRRHAALWVAVGSLAGARAALAAGAAQVWLDDAALDLWAASAPIIDHTDLPAGAVWLRHPATAALSPQLAAIGLPVVAGHLGVLVAARAAGLAAIADLGLNTYGAATLAALGDLGAQAAVISLECSGREIARLSARLGDGIWPAIAVVAHGRLPAMLTRQDHGLDIGGVQTIQAVSRDGGLPYELQRRRRDTVVWEGRRLCAPLALAPTATLVDGWVLELADLGADAVRELVTVYVALRDAAAAGDDPTSAAAAVETVARRHAPHGLFPGHLERGSRELDAVLERQSASEG